MVKYTTALRLGTADPEAILRRFTRKTRPTRRISRSPNCSTNFAGQKSGNP
jgi:hypothetical protein